GAGAVGKDGKLPPGQGAGVRSKTGVEVSKAAAQNFDAALASFLEHDKKQDWADASCSDVAKRFLDASDEQKSAAGKELPEAQYNAGLAYQRCGKDKEAREHFEAALKTDPSFHRARAQNALYDYAKSNDADTAIRTLSQVVRDAKFQNVEALVGVAALQMERGSDQSDEDGKNDLERAKKNLQRALAVDDTYMPAFNQLAVYYMEQAKAKAGGSKVKSRKGKRGMEVSGAAKAAADEQMLDLAALVASQAQRKNPNYAPIHNTIGLIQVELRNFNNAVKSFGRARQLDPKFYEAQMNYAAVNLSFRGFEEAEKAYREALKLRPNEYEAHLGLALAVRGQINDGNFDKSVAEAQKHLDEAKKIDGSRPETYYNEAILTQEYRAKRGNPIPGLEKAAQQYKEFIGKAGDDPVFAQAVKRSKDRSTDIEDTIKFIKEGEEARKAEEAAAKAAPPPAAAPAAPAAAPAPAPKK
ncbi:MAG TPA: tetratricopeptide repeat protein, partial [Polyangiaceae bacterium]|nr:tetratricopeptide repeat protein [Polyangiaceae bacterium]